MSKENLEKLRKHVYKLYKLLGLGQTGHFSWCIAVAEEWKAIAKMWSKPSENSVFFIEYLFEGKWYISYSNVHAFFVSYDEANAFIKDIPTLSTMPIRIKEYASIPETENEQKNSNDNG